MTRAHSSQPLDDVADMLSGGTPRKSNQSYWNGLIPWLTPKDMGRWSGGTEARVSPEAIGNGTRLAPVDAIFVAVRGMSLHNEIRVLRPAQAMTFNQDIKAIVAKQDIDPRYLYYVILSKKPELLDAVEAAGHGTGRLPTDRLKDLMIPRFGRLTEAAIAELFTAIDRRIDLNRRMNGTLEAVARALFKDWFVDFGPTRAKAEGRAPYLAPELWDPFPDALDEQDKPVGWEEEPVYAQAHWVNGAAYKNMHFTDTPDALPVIKIAELKTGVTKNTKSTNTALGDKYRIMDGELLFSWSGNPDTSIDAFIWVGGSAWLNQHIFAVRGNGKRPQPFLYAMLKWLKPEFAEIARNKQTTGLGHVTQQDLKRLLVHIGSTEVMAAFDELMKPIYDRILGNLIEMRVLAQTRDLLVPKLMSGEIRLRDAEAAVEEVA